MHGLPKTSFTLHNLPRTSYSLPSLSKTSFNMHNLSRTSCNLSSKLKTSSSYSLPSLSKTSVNLHSLSRTSCSLPSLHKTSFSTNLPSKHKTSSSYNMHSLSRTRTSLPSLQLKHSLASRTGKHLYRLAPTLTSLLNQWRSKISLVTRLSILCNRPNLHSFSSNSPDPGLCNNSSNPNSKSTVQITNHIHKRACLGNSLQLVAISSSLTVHNSAGNNKITRLSNHNKRHMLIVKLKSR